ncbi:MAG: response regulator transcription factor [Pseudomonadota bacterium]
MTIRIAIVDDHQLVRDGLASLLQDLDTDVEIVGQGANGAEAVLIAEQEQPDIMLMDVAMPDINGIDATQTIREIAPNVRVIAVTMHAERSFITGMLGAGAMGYIRKESAFEEISTAIEEVIEGRVHLGAGIEEIASDHGRSDSLSARETEVLTMIAEGKKTREIAAELFLSEKTVETHRRQISRKLKISSVAELTKYAIRRNLTSV